MPSTIVSLGCDVVDNDYFKRETEKTRRSAVSLRKKYDLPQNYFLSSGRFVEKKNFDFLLRSYAAYVKNVKKPWGFVLLGDGPLRKDFEKIARNLSVGSLLKMPGFIQYEQLPIYYGLAKSFILPSSMDQWGLVVNEAMASGLPVLVSNCCGCSFDLVQEGKNGWSFNPRDESQLTMLLEDLTRMSGVKRNFIGSKSSKIIENWSTDQFAEGIKKAAEDDFPITKTTALNRTLLELVIRYDRDWWHS